MVWNVIILSARYAPLISSFKRKLKNRDVISGQGAFAPLFKKKKKDETKKEEEERVKKKKTDAQIQGHHIMQHWITVLPM